MGYFYINDSVKYLANTDTQKLKVLSNEFGRNIDEVQIYKNENDPHKSFVFLFEPRFWWFKKRYRVTLGLFNDILSTKRLSLEEMLFCDDLDKVNQNTGIYSYRRGL